MFCFLKYSYHTTTASLTISLQCYLFLSKPRYVINTLFETYVMNTSQDRYMVLVNLKTQQKCFEFTLTDESSS